MRIIGCCILVLVLALMCVGVASANPSGGVKNSPLFKASLEKSIAKLEGKVQKEVLAGNEDEDMPTGKRICPNLPLTQQNTCSSTYCGGETCDVSCSGTCWTTCTPSTCYPGVCYAYSFDGTARALIGGQYYWFNGLPWPKYLSDERPVYCQFDDEGSGTFEGDMGSDGTFAFTRIRTYTSSGATVWLQPKLLSYTDPNWFSYGYGSAHLNGPLSASQTNHFGVVNVGFGS